jgi:hypothetical protein
MRRSVLTVLFAAIAGVLAACQSTEPPKAPNTTPSPAAPASPSPTTTGSPATSPSVDPKTAAAKLAALEGTWPGVDGTSLKVTKNGEKYKIEITGLDKKTETFEGTAKGDAIEFTRKGKVETIKAATGEETGIKGLQAEKTCVVITKGSEGYCRK